MAPQGETNVVHCYGQATRGDAEEKNAFLGRLRRPRGLHLRSDGTLLVADFDRNCVLSFTAEAEAGKAVAGVEGEMLPTVDPLKDIDRPLGPAEGEGRLLKRPGDVLEDSTGAVLVVDSDASRVQCFRLGEKAEEVVPVPGGPPHKSIHVPEAVKYPRSAALHEDGSLYVCDTWSHRILRFEAGEQQPTVVAGTPNSIGTSANHLCFPSGVCFDKDGNLLVADTNNHRIQRFEPGSLSGTTVAGSTEGKSGSGLAELNMPTSICVDTSSGSFFVTDRCNARVLRFASSSKAGVEGEVVACDDVLERPWGIATDSAGFLYVSDERQGFVLKVQLDKQQAEGTSGPRFAFNPQARRTVNAAPRQSEAPCVPEAVEKLKEPGVPATAAPEPVEKAKEVVVEDPVAPLAEEESAASKVAEDAPEDSALSVVATEAPEKASTEEPVESADCVGQPPKQSLESGLGELD
mmetsp:Transcript_22148/g.40734  ORF Transcript_22148/g.40734 Transcript_22148/m.40734 type:complete len:463 (-) Transcript_22148:59-1447(-)